MKTVQQLLGRMRTLWLLEHMARGVAVVLGVAVNVALLCLLLHRLLNLPLWNLYGVIALGIAAMGMVAARARAQAPSAKEMARLLDERAGTADLFASALEFHAQPERFGWLGQETWNKAVADATAVGLKVRWSVGRLRNWSLLGCVAGVLVITILSVGWMQGRKTTSPAAVAIAPASPGPMARATAENDVPPPPKMVAEVAPTVLPEMDTQATTQPAQETVKITNDMIEKYLHDMPGAQEVDLTGVTPIRWDQEEANGKGNPQDQQHEGEKVDPVKLDAALLKDLQTAKKTKDPNGDSKEGGVDIAVMANQGDLQAKGKEGGKKGNESLADAVSKDPRGQSSRMTVKPAQKAMPVWSSQRIVTRQKGEDRPMSILEFMMALERMKGMPPEATPGPSQNVEAPKDQVVRQENVPDRDAELTQTYFDLLRKADR